MGARAISDASPIPSVAFGACHGAVRCLRLAAVLLLAPMAHVAAFPLLDAATQDQVPVGTELAAPDAQDLRHQLQIVNGLAPPLGGGWTIVPQIDVQEMLTDNAEQTHSPRQWDLVTYIRPGVSIAGDLPRVQLLFNYSPALALYARTTSLNALTQQMNGLGQITLAPDLAFVDLRAVAGVHSQYGGLGGLGDVGSSATADVATTTATVPTVAGNSQGLNRNNEVQTSSYGISPYLLRRFGDWGIGKLGYSLDVTQSNTLSGFASLPFPTGGANSQTLVTNEQFGHFVTGDILQSVQNSIDIDLTQTQARTDANFASATTGLPAQNQAISSTREIFTDQITWQMNRSVALFVAGGHETINYSGFGAQTINDFTWNLGTTLTPGPDTSLTISYGHQNGFNSWAVNGHHALTARTLLTVSYSQTLGTQLEYLQNQLNLASVRGGTLVNAQNGGGTLFSGTNALAVQNGVFRTETLTLGSTTALERDIFAINLLMIRQAQTGRFGGGRSSSSKTVSLSWVHAMRPDMTLGVSFAYALQDQSGLSAFGPGNSTSFAASLAWQYQISDTVTAGLRYSLLNRSSAVSAFNIYENLLILGISKRF